MSVLKMTEQDTWGTSEEGLLLAGHPWQAKPNVYPGARATGTATALPTCMYLKYENVKTSK